MSLEENGAPRKAVKLMAINLAREHGLINLTREMVSTECSFPVDSFQHYAGVTFSTLVAELEREGHTGPIATVSRARTNPKLRKQQVLEAAVTVAIERGYQNMGRPDVAEMAGVSQALVSHYFGTLDNLRAMVMDYAVRNEVVAVVAQGLGGANDAARNAPAHLRDKAIQFLANN